MLTFESNLEEELINIQNHLIWESYRPGDYYQFTIMEPKKRVISALPFRDRVVQHALCNIITPILEHKMIYDSYACRIGKGSQRGVMRAQHFLRQCGPGCYILKADIHHFFDSINHEILKQILASYIKCPQTLNLMYAFINQSNSPCGVPIGNLTSQLYANIYLDQMDHFIKDDLGVKYYARYMDDFVVIMKDKSQAIALKEVLRRWLREHLKLELNGKTQVFPERHGLNFLGYRIWYDHILLRHGTVKRLKRKIKRFHKLHMQRRIKVADVQSTLNSWRAMSKWGNCRTIEKQIIRILNQQDK